MRSRCPWAELNPLLRAYHDKEWGKPQHNDRKLFELLILEGAQAGLSWLTVLRKREHYRKVFDRFDPKKISRYDRRKLNSLLKDGGIIRNRLKISGAVKNARAFLQVQKEFGSFDRFVWAFVDNQPKYVNRASLKQIPAIIPEAGRMSKELRKRGFTFVGPTICYAFMQAAGLVNDHITKCFLHPAQD